MYRILVVEDDASLGQTLQTALIKLPAEVEVATKLRRALEILRTDQQPFDLLLLDRHLPDGDGVSLLDVIQTEFRHLRVMIMTTADAQFEIEEGLQSGADDYLTKPFSWKELLLRVKNLLRSRKISPEDIFSLGKLTFYANAGRLVSPNCEIHLRAKESRLLRYFCERPNAVIGKTDLLKLFWNDKNLINSHIINVYIQRLRAHLGEQAALLQTIPKIGYQLKLAH